MDHPMDVSLKALQDAGYQAWGTEDGCVEVMDPVLVISGSHQRTQFVTRKLYSGQQAMKFLVDRS